MQIKIEANGTRAEGKTFALEDVKKALTENFIYVNRVEFTEGDDGSEYAVFDVATRIKPK